MHRANFAIHIQFIKLYPTLCFQAFRLTVISPKSYCSVNRKLEHFKSTFRDELSRKIHKHMYVMRSSTIQEINDSIWFAETFKPKLPVHLKTEKYSYGSFARLSIYLNQISTDQASLQSVFQIVFWSPWFQRCFRHH